MTMNKEEVMSHLSKYSNMVELIREASVLKSKGVDETVVNKVVMELRKSMLTKTSSIKRLKRMTVPDIDKQPYGTLVCSLQHLNKAAIEYDGNMIII